MVPLGSTEKHGAHIPLGTDSYITMTAGVMAADLADCLYAPLVPFGYSPQHMGRVEEGAGTITLQAETYRRVMHDVAPSLISLVKAIMRAHRFIYQDRKTEVDLIVKFTGFPRDAAEQAHAFLVQAGAWPVNDGLPRAMLNYTLDRLVEWHLLKPLERPSYFGLVDLRPTTRALRDLGRWTGDPRWR